MNEEPHLTQVTKPVRIANKLKVRGSIKLPLTTTHSRKEHLTFKANTKQGRHGWLRLTPAYSVHLVEELVSKCNQEDLVLDPFCGTGTTALACVQSGITCHTVDI